MSMFGGVSVSLLLFDSGVSRLPSTEEFSERRRRGDSRPGLRGFFTRKPGSLKIHAVLLFTGSHAHTRLNTWWGMFVTERFCCNDGICYCIWKCRIKACRADQEYNINVMIQHEVLVAISALSLKDKLCLNPWNLGRKKCFPRLKELSCSRRLWLYRARRKV